MSAKIICTASRKGGVGKSVTALNFGVYLAKHGHKILFIDMDSQKNLSVIFSTHVDKDTMQKSSIIRAFKHDAKNPASAFPSDFKPAHIDKHMDIFSGSTAMDRISEIMKTSPNIAPYVLMHILTTLKLMDKYDYIIIDTHNNFSIPTKNALIVADYIFSPITPSLFSVLALQSMANKVNDLRKKFYDVKTGKSDINAKLYFIGNMIKNTKESKTFVDLTKQHPDKFVALFKQRELVNKAIDNFHSVYGYATNSKDKKIIEKDINPQFKKMDAVLNK